MKIWLLAIAIGWLPAAYPQEKAPPHENLNAVLWYRSSPEAEASARQTYRAAGTALRQALTIPTWTAATEQMPQTEIARKPPAVILDLDETVLDNSVSGAEWITERPAKDDSMPYRFSSAKWQQWVLRKEAAAVPGAVDFLIDAQALGVALFYVTNRACQPAEVLQASIDQLRKLHVPLPDTARLLCRQSGKSGDKSERRSEVARDFRILLLIGDDLNDFISVPTERADRTRYTPAERKAMVAPYLRYFGERWFLLANPMYGSWERVFADDASREREIELKRRSLR